MAASCIAPLNSDEAREPESDYCNTLMFVKARQGAIRRPFRTIMKSFDQMREPYSVFFLEALSETSRIVKGKALCPDVQSDASRNDNCPCLSLCHHTLSYAQSSCCYMIACSLFSSLSFSFCSLLLLLCCSVQSHQLKVCNGLLGQLHHNLILCKHHFTNNRCCWLVWIALSWKGRNIVGWWGRRVTWLERVKWKNVLECLRVNNGLNNGNSIVVILSVAIVVVQRRITLWISRHLMLLLLLLLINGRIMVVIQILDFLRLLFLVKQLLLDLVQKLFANGWWIMILLGKFGWLVDTTTTLVIGSCCSVIVGWRRRVVISAAAVVVVIVRSGAVMVVLMWAVICSSACSLDHGLILGLWFNM